MDSQTRLLIEKVASAASEQAVAKMLTSLGVDPSHPFEVQKDMAALRELRALIDDPDFQRDMMHLRRWRKAMDSIQSKGLLTIVGLVVTGLMAALWLGLKGFVLGGGQ